MAPVQVHSQSTSSGAAEQASTSSADTQNSVDSSLISLIAALFSTSLLAWTTILYFREKAYAQVLKSRCLDMEHELKGMRGITEKEDLYNALAHDLKSPILGANRVLDIMLSGQIEPLSDKMREMLLKLKGSNSGLLKQVVNLLQLNHYSGGADTDSRATFDIAPMIREIATDFAGIAAPSRIKIEVAIDERLPVYGNRRALGSLFTNLIDNAVKHTPPESRVDITGTVASSLVTVKVCDTGAGIPADIQPKLFQRFWLESPGERYTTSTGLGLYLCKKIVEFHGGDISFQSVEGGGTTFTVTLPTGTVRRKDLVEQTVITEQLPSDRLVGP